MNFVLVNYELLNGSSQGLKTVCNLMVLHKKQIRKSTIYFLKSPKQLARFKNAKQWFEFYDLL